MTMVLCLNEKTDLRDIESKKMKLNILYIIVPSLLDVCILLIITCSMHYISRKSTLELTELMQDEFS